MKIYLMRHGEASYDAPHDDLRELTDIGRLNITNNIKSKLDELGSVEKFLSSPILRAKQTACLSQEVLGRADTIEEVDWLIHGSTPSAAISELAERNYSSVMLFSHQPFASYFVEELCGLLTGEVAMRPASIVAMESDPVAVGLGELIWQVR